MRQKALLSLNLEFFLSSKKQDDLIQHAKDHFKKLERQYYVCKKKLGYTGLNSASCTSICTWRGLL